MKPLRSWKLIAAVSAVLACHVALGMWSASQQSVTVDEIFHVTGGYCFNHLRDYRIHPDNGVLPQRLHALPAVLADAKPPPLHVETDWHWPDVTRVSYQFFYESGNDHWPLLLRARAINLLFSVGVVLLVFAWARRLAGDFAAFIALVLAGFSPSLLAHGPLATTDMSATLLLNASAGAFWVQLRRRRNHWAVGSAVLFGLACTTKYSAVLLVPVFVLLIALHVSIAPRSDWSSRFLVSTVLLHVLIPVTTIWVCFGLRYSLAAPGLPISTEFMETWNTLLDKTGWQGGVLRWLRRHEVLPEGFLWGYTHTYVGSLKRAAYLAGEYSDTGWRSFFPLAFVWKSTPAELAGILSIIVTIALNRFRVAPWASCVAPLLAFGGVYGVAAVTSHLNIGHRHLLPLYPALFISGGAAIAFAARRIRIARTAGVVVMGTQIVSAATIAPHFLAYFNAFAGGPANGYRLLVDSSLDWGQDLSRVKPWLDENNSGLNAQLVFLSYFGSGEPDYYGIGARRLPFVNGFQLPQPFVRLEAGLYVISATTLVQVYSPFRGPWTAKFEREFQQLRFLEPLFDDYTRNPARRAELLREAPAEQWRRGWMRYDLLRFARLCHYLRVRQANDHLGYSLLIYRLSAREVAAATGGTLDDWSALIEAAVASRR